MTISVRDLMDGDTELVSEQALNNNLTSDGRTPYLPFTLRELITPQYEVAVDSGDTGWENWVDQHAEERVVYRPETREQVIAAVVQKAHSDGKIRAVGSGHSHSNAPEPPDHYIDLNPGNPGSEADNGLNDTLPNGPDDSEPDEWLHEDGTLSSIDDRRDHGDAEVPPLDREHLERLQAGITLRRLNRHLLHPNGKALNNMGSFDGQTIAGAVNTSTHGTGVRLPSISDSVESVEMATVPESASGEPIVRSYRIEPSDGVTDREAFEADIDQHRTALIQDDDIFHSAVVGYGCMGVAYAYTMRVRDSYWLREETELFTWDGLVTELKNGNGEVTSDSVEAFLTRSDGNTDCRHTVILVNIATDQVDSIGDLFTHEAHGVGRHEEAGNPLCLVKRHYELDESEIPEEPENFPPFGRTDDRWPPERKPEIFRYIGKQVSDIHLLAPNKDKPTLLHNGFFHGSDTDSPFIGGGNKSAWYVALRRIRDGGANNSEHYHPIAPIPPTMTTEAGVELGNLVDAAEATRQTVQRIEQQDAVPNKLNGGKGKNVFFPVPMGIRFTASSEHYLSPEYDRKTAMIEVPLPIYDGLSAKPLQGLPSLTFGENRDHVIVPALRQLHNHLVFTGDPGDPDFDARPHMGKHNEVGRDWLEANYARFESDGDETAWMDVYRRFNQFGTFDNEFTDQLGISQSGDS
jgi:hypothetical protein